MSSRSHGFRWKPPVESGDKTPSWKDTYRQRCMERLRDKRFKHLLIKRQSLDTETSLGTTVNQPQSMKDRMMRDIQAMMSTEWDLIQEENDARKGPEIVPAPSVDEMIALMEDILEELKAEKLYQPSEQDQCEEYVRQEEEELCHAFHRLNAVEVVCPLCQINCLKEAASKIFCQCGLLIDTEQDCINLKNVQDNLQNGMTEHGDVCEYKPCFSQMNNFGISTLIMSCQQCDFHYVIV